LLCKGAALTDAATKETIAALTEMNRQQRRDLLNETQKDRIMRIGAVPLYYGDITKANDPFKDPKFYVKIKATYLNACLVHAVNESLQGYFFVDLNSFINAINHAHKLSGVENLATFVKMQGFYVPVGVPLVPVVVAGVRQYLALAEVSEQLTWPEIKKMMQDPIILANMANNTGVSTLIIVCEFIEPKSLASSSRSG
jgi:hypothetical protein